MSMLWKDGSIVTLMAAAGCAGPPAHPQGPGPERISEEALTRIDSVVESAREERRISGVSIAILRGDRMVLARGDGLANRSEGIGATPGTIYPVGSISKHFTAAAIMCLVEEGRVELDRPISDYLPEYPVGKGSPLVRHLLAQTSGIADDDLPELERIDPRTIDDVIAVIGREPPRFSPGSRWAYSNSNYTLLAAIVESASGQAHDDFLTRRLLEPLGLVSTSSVLELSPSSRLAIGYANESGDFTVDDLDSNRVSYIGNGGMASTATELVRWMRALADGRVVSAESYRTMTAPSPVALGYTPPYGFGLSLAPMAERPCVSHTGVTDGFTTSVALFPEDDLIVAVLTNARHLWITEILEPIVRTILGHAQPAIRDLPLTAEEAEAYTGTYDDGLFVLRIRRDGDRLALDVEELGPPKTLLYQGDQHFVSALEPDSIRLWFEGSGERAERVVFEWLELRSFGERVDRRSEAQGGEW